MSEMFELLKELSGLRLAPVSTDTDRLCQILTKILPFKVHQYPTESECNGWIVPLKWDVEKAEIRKDGKLIYQGTSSPLGVIGYSQSFEGTVSLEQLLPHLFTHADRQDDLVYHCDLYYKVGQKNWGFSVPEILKSTLEPGTYDIELRTNFQTDTMKVLDYFLPGTRTDTIVLNAHNCHAGQANDDISGIVVGMEVMRRLEQMTDRRLSYRLIIAPEHFGTVFYLDGLSTPDIAAFNSCIFLEGLGNDNRLAIQHSFTGDTYLDRASLNYAHHFEQGYETFPFRKLVGNDETVWEAPGYEVPTITLSRFPFAQYHSSEDTPDFISKDRLEQSVEATLSIIEIMDKNIGMERQFKGLIALSNPKYDLYIQPQTDPSLAGAETSPEIDAVSWNYLMDCIPRYFDGKTSVLDIADRHNLPFKPVYEYVSRFAEKGLVEFREL